MEVFKRILVYMGLKKADPDAPTSNYLRMMHGINRISIFVFLIALILLIVKLSSN